MEVRELSDEDHEVLGAEYCSGYTDIFGKWNTGFYCPNLGNDATVYCCGTVTYKYCCTRRDQQSSAGISQSVMLGSALGSVLVFALVTLVSCLACRKCVGPYRRAHTSLSGGPLYSLHCSSTASGVANMYSFSTQNTPIATPLDIRDGHGLVDLDCSHDDSSYPGQRRSGMHSHRGISALGQGECPRSHLPVDPPPPYNEDSSGQTLMDSNQSLGAYPGETTSFMSPQREPRRVLFQQTSTFDHHQPPHLMNNAAIGQENLYWSTKF